MANFVIWNILFLAKLAVLSKKEEENASKLPGIISLVLVTRKRSGTVGVQPAAWRGRLLGPWLSCQDGVGAQVV